MIVRSLTPSDLSDPFSAGLPSRTWLAPAGRSNASRARKIFSKGNGIYVLSIRETLTYSTDMYLALLKRWWKR